jgi:biotin synthase
MIFFAGASGMMVGDFLTTKNRSVSDDLKMVRDLGLDFGSPLFAPERQGATASIRLATGAAL